MATAFEVNTISLVFFLVWVDWTVWTSNSAVRWREQCQLVQQIQTTLWKEMKHRHNSD
jgi:hypothetical protein